MTRHSETAPMQGMTLVRGAHQLLTLRGPAGPRRGAALRDLGLIEDGAVLIRNGKILEAGPSRRLENLKVARGAHEINAAGRRCGSADVCPGGPGDRTACAAGTPAGRACTVETCGNGAPWHHDARG